ncbi:hypothetical protein ACOQFV_27215 [Nocardiopsis changdeensis]|uniref:Uncharacterized protein n=1 Tax=Nocardiopsis changdeensis TaxID=2831969 RepID=A0ABX8BLN9_9ACTN|nr:MULTISPECIES: hypothetical protein [Nocardiopsis]QUX22959.1 hypothetical protein KGD84_00675 [Nocardiopsis changdeensis]QYX38902.1 hypothetical protein K1J57_10125 [Nocardiopsis sp. MT53]
MSTRWICGAERLTPSSTLRRCVLDPHHAGHHQDEGGETWVPPEVVLKRLRAAYGQTHRIAWTGRMWIATNRDPDAPWRSEVEPTPEQLETRLRDRQGVAPETTPPAP